jgi:catechol 2,3-dioxygenase-like lactoylglutathione lyase family enzyme
MHDDAPRLDGVHHLQLPVTDLERSSSWYRSRLGFEPDMEFQREGRLVGLALKHPHGGPGPALRLDPERAAAADRP